MTFLQKFILILTCFSTIKLNGMRSSSSYLEREYRLLEHFVQRDVEKTGRDERRAAARYGQGMVRARIGTCGSCKVHVDNTFKLSLFIPFTVFHGNSTVCGLSVTVGTSK